VTAKALNVHASAKAPAESLKPSTPSELFYFRGNIKCNFEEATSLYGQVYGLTKGGFITRAGGFGWRCKLLPYLRRYKIPQMGKLITRASLIIERAPAVQFYLPNSLSTLRSLETQLAFDPLLLSSLDILRQKPEQMLKITTKNLPRLNANSSSQH
jgi:hypothetical protein